MTRTRFSSRRLKRFLAPSFGLRRYLTLSLIGLLLFLGGIALSFKVVLGPFADWSSLTWKHFISSLVREDSVDVTNHILGGVMMIAGLMSGYIGVNRAFLKLREGPGPKGKGVDMEAWRRKQLLAAGPRIVVMGGGTGLSTLLRGLKQHSSNITAIVTVSDDGGSSGRLVKDLGIMPPGDIRNCLVALADAEKFMTDLFQHRFKARSGSLSGHSLGNLLIAGLIEQCGGDVDLALEMASEVLAIRGRVVPSTMDHVQLRAMMDDGTEIEGETMIVDSGHRIRRVYLHPPDCKPHPAALEAIAEAELICIGPGSVFSSVIPNFLVPGIAQAVAAAKVPKVYICNVMTQQGESEAFTAAEHVLAIQANVDVKVADYVVINTGVPTQAILDKYRDSRQELVRPDYERVATMGYRPIIGNFMSETDFVRHDPARLAARLMELV